jgi:hypothetical protein
VVFKEDLVEIFGKRQWEPEEEVAHAKVETEDAVAEIETVETSETESSTDAPIQTDTVIDSKNEDENNEDNSLKDSEEKA